MKLGLLIAAAALPFSMISTTAYAQDEAAGTEGSKADTGQADEAEAEEASGPFEIDVEVGIHSDYRFRGISLSGKDAQITGEVYVEHESGVYGDLWISNVDLGSGDGDELEVDLSAGWTGDVGPLNLDVGGVYYLYPSESDFNYLELYASAGYAIGEGEIRAGFAFAPSQDALGNKSNRYYYVSGEMPIGESPVSVHGSFGIEDGAFADRKKDWLVGVSVDAGSGITATLDYVDTSRAFTPLGKATLVGRLVFAF